MKSSLALICAIGASLAIGTSASAQKNPGTVPVLTPGSLPPAAPPTGGALLTVDLSKVPGLVTGNATTATPKALPVGSDLSVKENMLKAVKALGKTKKPAASAAGVWKWTTFNRSLQPMENVLTLSVDKKGEVKGTLLDRTGLHPVDHVTVGNGTVSFDVKYHTRGEGDLPHTFTVNLDPDNPGVSVDSPDFTPTGKANGGRHHSDHAARHDPSG